MEDEYKVKQPDEEDGLCHPPKQSDFEPGKLLKLRNEMLATIAATDKHSEEADRLYRARNEAEQAFSAYARGGQKALDELNMAIAQMDEQNRIYDRAGLNTGCGAGGQYQWSTPLGKQGRLS